MTNFNTTPIEVPYLDAIANDEVYQQLLIDFQNRGPSPIALDGTLTLLPVDPTQITKEYTEPVVITYDRSLLPRYSEVATLLGSTGINITVGDLHYVEISDTYLGSDGNYYVATTGRLFIPHAQSRNGTYDGEYAETDATLWSPGSATSVESFSEAIQYNGGTSGTEASVDFFLHVRLATDEEIEAALEARDAAEEYGFVQREDGTWEPAYFRLDDTGSPEVFQYDQCFLAGTSVRMADGGELPIERVEVGHNVMSYTEHGDLVPGKVTQLYRNDVRCVLDVHGMMITPGHSTLCADGDAKGQHIPIIDIILSDGALMLENGTCIRASTGEAVGSKLDQFVNLRCAENLSDLNAGQFCNGRARLGTKLFNASGKAMNIWQMLSQNGFDYDVDSENVISPNGQVGPMKFIGALPKSEDYILAKSGLTLASIYSAGEWTETRQINTGNFSAVVPAASN